MFYKLDLIDNLQLKHIALIKKSDINYKLYKMNILFVCTFNKIRSLTAQQIFQDDNRFNVKSAGVDPASTVQINHDILEWADYIIVMEKAHRNKIRKNFPGIYEKKRIVCLYIPDEYDYMEPVLIELLKRKFEFIWKTEIEPDLNK